MKKVRLFLKKPLPFFNQVKSSSSSNHYYPNLPVILFHHGVEDWICCYFYICPNARKYRLAFFLNYFIAFNNLFCLPLLCLSLTRLYMFRGFYAPDISDKSTPSLLWRVLRWRQSSLADGWELWKTLHNEGVYYALFKTLRNLENFSQFSLEPCNGRCPCGYDYTYSYG